MRRAGSREVVGSGCGSSRTCARPSTRYFRAVVSSRPPRCWGKTTTGTLGVDGWAPYRCFKEATLQTCYNHLLHRCHELLETATRGAVRFPRLVKAILRHALALRDRRDAGEISPHGLRVAKGLGSLRARRSNRLAEHETASITNPANQRFGGFHLRRYRATTSLCSSTVRTSRPPTIVAGTRHSHRRGDHYRKTCGGSATLLTAKGAQASEVDPHERPPELPSQRDPRDRHRHVNPSCSRQHPRPLGQPRAVNNYESSMW